MEVKEMSDSIVEVTAGFVKEKLATAERGHDWRHVERVWRNARVIGAHENVDMRIVEIGALLHDIADAKFHDGDEEVGPKIAREFLSSQAVDEETIVHVENIIRHVSFKGSLEGQRWMSPELAVVQDADRLDGMGAIGIARTFHYGGYKNREIYNPDVPPMESMTKEAYMNSDGHSINHFYEKLLLLKNRMNTETGKRFAESRHRFMEMFLEQFFREWNGEV